MTTLRYELCPRFNSKWFTGLLIIGLIIGMNPACAEPPPSILEVIATTGDAARVQKAIAEGADPNTEFIPIKEDWEGATPLHLAALLELPKVMEVLLANGADVNLRARNVDGASPLGWAIYFGKYRSVEILLAHGADITIEDNHGNNPMQINAVGLTDIGMQAKLKALLMEYGAR